MSRDHAFGAAEIPLVPTAIYGMRAFTVRKDGTLGPLHRMPEFRFQPGVNRARCDTSHWEYMLNGTRISMKPSAQDIHSLFHGGASVPTKNCSCGYYGYFDVGPEYDTAHMTSATDRVQGIVRASGKCVVGELGFRAEKLEIVGLVGTLDTDTRKRRLSNFMSSINLGIAKVPGWAYILTLVLYWTTLILTLIFDKNPVFEFLYNSMLLFVMSWIIVNIAVIAHTIHAIRTTGLIADMYKPDKQLTCKMQEQYPDAKIFSSLQEAKAYFPLSKASDLPK